MPQLSVVGGSANNPGQPGTIYLPTSPDSCLAVDAEESGSMPRGISLRIGPNPSRDGVGIQFGIPSAQPVRVDVFDVAGRHVATLTNGERGAGWHTVQWGAGDRRFSSGVYFTRIVARDGTETRRFVVVH
jgi:hypothetical protein